MGKSQIPHNRICVRIPYRKRHESRQTDFMKVVSFSFLSRRQVIITLPEMQIERRKFNALWQISESLERSVSSYQVYLILQEWGSFTCRSDTPRTSVCWSPPQSPLQVTSHSLLILPCHSCHNSWWPRYPYWWYSDLSASWRPLFQWSYPPPFSAAHSWAHWLIPLTLVSPLIEAFYELRLCFRCLSAPIILPYQENLSLLICHLFVVPHVLISSLSSLESLESPLGVCSQLPGPLPLFLPS